MKNINVSTEVETTFLPYTLKGRRGVV
jgi:hypothetical protein